jgi:hypothetical protein
MQFDSTLNWQSILTIVAIVSSWAISLTVASLTRKRRQDVVRATVAMYLDALRVKTGVAKNTYFQANTRVPTGRNSFETAGNRA